MKVSIVIPTYNEEKTIGECLDSLSRQSFRDFEIIIVDDGSTDRTMSVLSELKIKNLKFKILKQDHKGAGTARNLGVKHAVGDILVFVDVDMTFAPDFIEKLIEPISGDPTLPERLRGARGTFSKEEYVLNWDNVWARCWNINEGWMEQRRHPKHYPDKQKVFRAILKSEFDRVGGFDPKRGYTDDWSLSERLGYEASSAVGAVFYHKNPDALLKVFRQARWAAKRRYKLGVLGYFVSLVRVSFPISFLSGLSSAIRHQTLAIIPFKIVSDFGAFVGILEFWLLGDFKK